MKKVLKVIGIIIGIVLIVVLAGASFIALRGIPSYEAQKPDYKAHTTPEGLERGKRLAMLLCANCHADPATGKLTGKQMVDAPKEFGPIFSQNITQDKTYGIGTWTDGEILYLLRTGIKRDGKYAPPYMAKLPHMADEDINAIIAFLRSDDPLVTAAAVPDRPCEPTFLTKFLCTVAFKPLPMPDHKIDLPPAGDKVALGKYMVFNLECYSCHSADFKKLNVGEPEKTEGYLIGGNKPLDKEGRPMVTPNLTPDPETGIGKWSEDRFVNAVKYGLMQDAPALRYPMVPYAQLTDDEAKAIYAYLQTVPAVHNPTPRSQF